MIDVSTNLPPSVQEFKAFVQDKPYLIREVRAGRATWQSLYEDWAIVGEDETYWRDPSPTQETKENTHDSDSKRSPFAFPGMSRKKEEPTATSNTSASDADDKGDFMDQVNNIMGYVKKVDVDQVQSHMKSLGSVLSSIQDVIGQFQGGTSAGAATKVLGSALSDKKSNPFSFRKD